MKFNEKEKNEKKIFSRRSERAHRAQRQQIYRAQQQISVPRAREHFLKKALIIGYMRYLEQSEELSPTLLA